MDPNTDQSALYQVFQESFSKQLVGSSYPEYSQVQQPQAQQPQVQSNVWPPHSGLPVQPPHGQSVQQPPQPHNPYPGAELDFPGSNPGSIALDAMRGGQVPGANFYGQEFYDMQPQHTQPQSLMQGYYETGNNLMSMPQGPSYPASPSPASSWPQQYPVVPVPTKIEPPSTPVPSIPGVNEAYFNPTPDPRLDPMGLQSPPPSNEQYPDPFAIEQPSSTVPPPPKRGAASRNSVGKGGLKATGGVNKRRGKQAQADDNLAPHIREHKDKERRVSNNSRERIRIRDINEALTELGRVVMTLRPKAADKPQTKLAVLNMAVDVITHLEKKVRDRNLNPAALSLNRGPAQPTPPPPQFVTPSPPPNQFINSPASSSSTMTSDVTNMMNNHIKYESQLNNPSSNITNEHQQHR